MVQTCANPACTAKFLYLHQGRLFVLETRTNNSDAASPEDIFNNYHSKSPQYFWLCDSCLRELTLRYGAKSHQVKVGPRRTTVQQSAA